ncbi:hypothetical protein ACFX2A_027256 [Malus domestica]
MMQGTPTTPSAKLRRTPCSTPGGSVRLRPLNRREQAIRQKGIFVLKFSALENYNETVVDLLKRKSGSLWLLDDSEKGTIVDKPQEEIVEKLANI